MKSEERAKELREALAQARQQEPSRRYPEPLRRAAAEYRQERAREGVGLHRAAKELGVSIMALLKWSRKLTGDTAKFHAIEIVPEPRRNDGKTSKSVVVHGPRGLRVEGLSVAEIAELMTRLT